MKNLNINLVDFIKTNDGIKREVDDKIEFKNYDGKLDKDLERIQYFSVFKLRFDESKPFLIKQFEQQHPKLKLFDNLIKASLMSAKKNVRYIVLNVNILNNNFLD